MKDADYTVLYVCGGLAVFALIGGLISVIASGHF